MSRRSGKKEYKGRHPELLSKYYRIEDCFPSNDMAVFEADRNVYIWKAIIRLPLTPRDKIRHENWRIVRLISEFGSLKQLETLHSLYNASSTILSYAVYYSRWDMLEYILGKGLNVGMRNNVMKHAAVDIYHPMYHWLIDFAARKCELWNNIEDTKDKDTSIALFRSVIDFAGSVNQTEINEGFRQLQGAIICQFVPERSIVNIIVEF